MPSSLTLRVVLVFASLLSVAASPHGDVWQPAYCLDKELRGPSAPYVPQAGDIVFFNYDDGIFWKVGFKLALSGPPDHSGIIVAMPDGTHAVAESGADDGMLVTVCSLEGRLRFHDGHRGPVWVRRRTVPLTAEQSCRLTEFAINERTKQYAVWRLLGQATVLRSRGPFRTEWAGKPVGPKDTYFCSEYLLEAGVYAGFFDPETTRPRATYPEDFFFDRSRNRYVNKHFNLACHYSPPQRLTFEGRPCCKEPKGPPTRINPAAIPPHPYLVTSPN